MLTHAGHARGRLDLPWFPNVDGIEPGPALGKIGCALSKERQALELKAVTTLDPAS